MWSSRSIGIALLAVGAGAPISDLHAAGPNAACATPDQQAERTSTIHPPYPFAAILFCIEGYARFEYTIQPDGTASDIEVADGEPEGVFDAAGEIIRFWTHKPQCRDGEPVAHKVTTKIEFSLEQVDSMHCPESLPSELLDAQIALFSLHQEVRAAVNDPAEPLQPMPVTSELDEPLASIERAHRRYLNAQLGLARKMRLFPVSALERLTRPNRLADAADFSSARQLIHVIESRRRELRRELLESAQDFRRELVALSDMPGMTPAIWQLMIGEDAEQEVRLPNHAHDRLALEASLFRAYRELLGWLEKHRHEWEVIGGELNFASTELASRHDHYRQLIAETWHRARLEFFSPARIEWSGF